MSLGAAQKRSALTVFCSEVHAKQSGLLWHARQHDPAPVMFGAG